MGQKAADPQLHCQTDRRRMRVLLCPSRLCPELGGVNRMNFARVPALTPRLHKPGTMLCLLVELIAVEYEPGNRRSLVSMLLRNLTFESPWIRVEIGKALAELLFRGVWEDLRLVSPFL